MNREHEALRVFVNQACLIRTSALINHCDITNDRRANKLSLCLIGKIFGLPMSVMVTQPKLLRIRWACEAFRDGKLNN